MKKKNTQQKLVQLHFKDIKIFYNLPNQTDVYFISDDTTYNKWVNEMLLDMWYKRLWLYKSDWLIELHLWFEYKRHWIYYRDDELYIEEKERRDNIRKAPILDNT